MTRTEIDAAEVLRAYTEVLSSGTTIVRDADELPYSKPIISSVLEHCLALNNDEPTANFLRTAYISLADFQPLSDDQRSAIEVMESNRNPSTLSDKDLQQMAVRMAKLGSIYQELQSKISSEIETLNRKLDELVS